MEGKNSYQDVNISTLDKRHIDKSKLLNLCSRQEEKPVINILTVEFAVIWCIEDKVSYHAFKQKEKSTLYASYQNSFGASWTS